MDQGIETDEQGTERTSAGCKPLSALHALIFRLCGQVPGQDLTFEDRFTK
jgi:hypothetical protein